MGPSYSVDTNWVPTIYTTSLKDEVNAQFSRNRSGGNLRCYDDDKLRCE
jgi:hypothetical protein